MSATMANSESPSGASAAAAVPRGYRRTEAGVIPDEWTVRSLRSCLRSNPAYGINAAAVPFDDSLPTYLRITDIGEDNRFRPSPRVSVKHPGALDFFLRVGDLVFARTGASVGKSYLYDPKDGPLVFAGFLIRVRPDPRQLQTAFLAYCVQSKRYWDWVATMSIRSGQPGINGREYGALQLVLPEPDEQRAIAEALSDLDGLLGALESLIAKKRAIKQGAMQQLLTRKTRLPDFSGDWAELNMTRDSVLKARIGWQGLTTAEYQTTGDYYLVTGTDFVMGRVDWATCHFVEHSRFIQDRNIQLAPSDVLLTKDGTIGKAGFVDSLPGPATLNSGVFVIRPKAEAYVPKYMYYVLTSQIFDDFLARLQAGSTISHLYQRDFLGFTFNAPQVPEQLAIATMLSDMDAEIAALEQQRDKTRGIKQGVMQQLLTGRVRLVKLPQVEASA
jgi:type I restriction enzyme S subunit